MDTARDVHLFGPGKKRILAIDGGGSRGALALGVLHRVETLLRDSVPPEQRADFRLSDYFDLITGTSTGSIIAAGLAMGLSVEDLRKLYMSVCQTVFSPAGRKFFSGTRKPRFHANDLRQHLDRVLREVDGAPVQLSLSPNAPTKGEPIRLGSHALKTGLAVFSKRVDTGGMWALINSPRWKYFDKAGAALHGLNMDWDPNANFPLSELVLASAAAPTFFEDVNMRVGKAKRPDNETTTQGVDHLFEDGVFVDGAMSGRNTPALASLMLATHPVYGLNWSTGGDNLMMLSIGTGWWRPKVTDQIMATIGLSRLAPEAAKAVEVLKMMIHDSSLTAITTLQSLSESPTPAEELARPANRRRRWTIDGELDDLLVRGAEGANEPSAFVLGGQPLLRFRRVDARLEKAWLEDLFGRPLADEFQEFKVKPTDQHKKLSDAWNATETKERNYQTPMIMRLRDLAEYDTDALRLLNHIGKVTGQEFVDMADFPEGFMPPANVLDDLRHADPLPPATVLDEDATA